jgi:LPXTG-motif cell wall-anchored protein
VKAVSVVVSAAAAAVLVFAGIAPASAAGSSIDPGDTLYAIACNRDGEPPYPMWQLLSVAPETGASTPIGGGEPLSYGACALQAAYDPATGNSYYIQKVTDESVGYYLASIDPSPGSGVSTRISPNQLSYVVGEFPVYPEITAMAIGTDNPPAVSTPDRVGYLVGTEGQSNRIYYVDLANGAIGPLYGAPAQISAFAFNPADGKFYMIDELGAVYSFDPSSPSFDPVNPTTVVGNVSNPGDLYRFHSLQIDESGRFWIEADENDTVSQLASFTLDTLNAPVLSGDLTDDPYFTSSLLLIPGATPVVPDPVKPKLAATGTDAWPLAGLAALLALAGAAVLVVRRRTAQE